MSFSMKPNWDMFVYFSMLLIAGAIYRHYRIINKMSSYKDLGHDDGCGSVKPSDHLNVAVLDLESNVLFSMLLVLTGIIKT